MSHGGARAAARLAAVQALYEMDIAGAGSDAVLREFMAKRWSLAGIHFEETGEPGPDINEPDNALMVRLVKGVGKRRAELDDMITANLSRERGVEGLEAILRAILRTGAFELLEAGEVPARAVIKEYVELADGFFAGREPALVNAVLDGLAHVLRQREFEEPDAGGA